MSLIPYWWNDDLLPSTYNPNFLRMWDMDRDWGRMERDMMRPMHRAMADLNRATRRLRRDLKDVESDVICDDKKFQARIDCHSFKPEEVSVRHVGKELLIEGKHEERPDEHGFTSRTFTRRYRLPDDALEDNVKCDLSSDGILTINVPRQPALTGGEKLLEIQQTGKPALPA